MSVNNLHTFFDTETTGLFKKHWPISYHLNPHIVQLAALQTDAYGNELKAMNRIIKPEGWVISEAVAKIHGITQERAMTEGIPLFAVMEEFRDIVKESSVMVAHNNFFDLKLLEIEYYRLKLNTEEYMKKTHYCTMQMTRNICKLPPTDKMLAAGMTMYKVPKLMESYKHFFGKGFEGAHDAVNDVRACKEVFFKVFSKGL